MANKTKYSRADVIKAGFEQLQEKGWEGVTPKSVAAKLGASTMPIFSHFATMKALKAAIMDWAWERLEKYASQKYTGDIWIDQGIGYILFARDHGQAFSCMHYGEAEEVRTRRLHFWKTVSAQLEGHPRFAGLESDQAAMIRHARSLIAHGIAVTVSSGFTPVYKDEDVIQKMVMLCSEVLFEGFSARKEELEAITGRIPPKIRARIQGIA